MKSVINDKTCAIAIATPASASIRVFDWPISIDLLTIICFHIYILTDIFLFIQSTCIVLQFFCDTKQKYSERIENFASLLYNGTGSICNTRRRYRNYD